jgi:hypothetical protein
MSFKEDLQALIDQRVAEAIATTTAATQQASEVPISFNGIILSIVESKTDGKYANVMMENGETTKGFIGTDILQIGDRVVVVGGRIFK